jgi:hypothetical protein
MNHDELKKQFEAEAAANPMAWKNWQWWQALSDNRWQPVGTGGPGWSQTVSYRRDPSKPPFVAPTMKERAMERVGEVEYPASSKRHKYADLAIAAVEGVKQMQRAYTDACFGMTHPATYKDCSSEVALELIMGGFGYQVRIKPALQLIDWSKMPAGTMTNHGELLKVNSLTQSAITLVGCDTEYWKLNNLRLAEQTTFTHLPKGTPPPVVEGLVFEYEYPAAIFVGATIVDYATGHTWLHSVPCIYAYRVIGVDHANGWTDDPSNAAA